MTEEDEASQVVICSLCGQPTCKVNLAEKYFQSEDVLSITDKTLPLDIKLFGQVMESVMRKHEKKKGCSWHTCSIEFLEKRLVEEVKEYIKSRDKVELVDVANFCMMLYVRKLGNIWVCGDDKDGKRG